MADFRGILSGSYLTQKSCQVVMNRLNLSLSKVALAAIILFISSSAAFAQVSYTITGTANLQSGPDLLGLDQETVSATATLTQSTPPSTSLITSTSSTNTYANVAGVNVGGIPCATSTPVTATLTDNPGESTRL